MYLSLCVIILGVLSLINGYLITCDHNIAQHGMLCNISIQFYYLFDADEKLHLAIFRDIIPPGVGHPLGSMLHYSPHYLFYGAAERYHSIITKRGSPLLA